MVDTIKAHQYVCPKCGAEIIIPEGLEFENEECMVCASKGKHIIMDKIS